jgi:hypothetical protein
MHNDVRTRPRRQHEGISPTRYWPMANPVRARRATTLTLSHSLIIDPTQDEAQDEMIDTSR